VFQRGTPPPADAFEIWTVTVEVALLDGRTMEERPQEPVREPRKWPLRQTFAFLLVLGGCFWIVLGIILKVVL